MLRNFYLENWKSFSDPVVLSMIATREHRDGSTLAKTTRPDARVLPLGVLFGANAAGKSSLIDALASLQYIVTRDRGDSALLPVYPSRYTPERTMTTFEVEIVTHPDDQAYRYTIVATRSEILEESLVWIRSTVEKTVFFRRTGEETQLHPRMAQDRRIRVYVETVEKNESLLRRIAIKAFENTEHVIRAFEWFRDTLRVINPEMEYVYLPAHLRADRVYREALERELSTADTGIEGIEFVKVPLSRAAIDDDDLDMMRQTIASQEGSFCVSSVDGNLYLVTADGAEGVQVEGIYTTHRLPNGTETFNLPLDQESDGTVRFLHLLPMLFELEDLDHPAVFVVDELDRSVHSHLIREIVKRYLESRSATSRSQLIFTTHDASLLRTQPMRRDEIWFVGKKGDGFSSDLTRLSELSHWGIRDSTDLFGAYLAGQLPGSPQINT